MKLFNRRNLVLFLGLTALVIALYTWSRLDTPLTPAKVSTARVGSLIQTFRTNGVVEAVDFREMRADFASRVLEVLVHEGDKVRNGQSLARLDDRDLQAAAAQARSQLLEAEQALAKLQSAGALDQLDALIAQAKADLDLATSVRARNKVLLDQKAISRQEFDESDAAYLKARDRLAALQKQREAQARSLDPLAQAEAKARLEQARVQLANAQSRLQTTRLLAPLAGTVLALPLRPGMLVNPGDLLAKVADLDRLQVRAFVDQPDFSSIHLGSPVQITSNGFPGETWQGKVTWLSAELTTVGKRVVGQALCSIEDGRYRLPVNSNIDLTFTSREIHDALLVPVDAVLQMDNRNYVYVVGEGNRLHLREVQAGASNTDSIVIRSGLKANEMVLADLEVRPHEGMPIQPRQP